MPPFDLQALAEAVKRVAFLRGLTDAGHEARQQGGV